MNIHEPPLFLNQTDSNIILHNKCQFVTKVDRSRILILCVSSQEEEVVLTSISFFECVGWSTLKNNHQFNS